MKRKELYKKGRIKERIDTIIEYDNSYYKNKGIKPLKMYKFPYEKLYAQQLEQIKAINIVLYNGGIGMFESPTGTGKTLSLLYAVLNFLYDKNYKNVFSSTLSLSMDRLWARCLEVRMNNINYMINDDINKKEKDIFSINTNNDINKKEKDMIVNNTKNDINTDDLDKQFNVWLNESSNKIDDDTINTTTIDPSITELSTLFNNNNKLKLVYMSRTHTQLNQFLNEVKRMNDISHYNLTNGIGLGSRSMLCHIPEIRNLGNTLESKQRCHMLQKNTKKNILNTNDKIVSSTLPILEADIDIKKSIDDDTICDLEDITEIKTCLYYNSKRITQQSDELRKGIYTISDSIELGEKYCACAYYASKQASLHTDIVALPYTAIFSSIETNEFWIRKDKKYNEIPSLYMQLLQKSIVVIDEAHNIPDLLLQKFSCTISIYQLEYCIVFWEFFLNERIFLNKINLLTLLRTLQRIYTKLLQLILNIKERSLLSSSKSYQHYYRNKNKNNNSNNDNDNDNDNDTIVNIKISDLYNIIELNRKEIDELSQQIWDGKWLMRCKQFSIKWQNNLEKNYNSVDIKYKTSIERLRQLSPDEIIKQVQQSLEQGYVLQQSQKHRDQDTIIQIDRTVLMIFQVCAEIPFLKILQQCYSVLLLGGTLTPARYYSGLQFPSVSNVSIHVYVVY